MIEPQQCAGVKANGQRCSHKTNLIGGLCIFHDPSRRDRLTLLRQKGAKASTAARIEKRRVRLAMASTTAGPRPPVGDSLASIAAWLRWCLEAGARGEIQRAELMAFTTTARALQECFAKRDLEHQLKRALKELATLKRRAR